jgi:hypothetical protein
MSGAVAVGLFPRAHKLLAFIFLFVGSLAILTNVFHPRQMDFISYWAASVLALHGKAAAAYDMPAHRAVQETIAVFDSPMPFPYPPPFLIILLPFGLLPYTVAAGSWIVTTFLAYLTAAKRLLPGSGWLVAAFPPVLVNAIIGQNGFVTATIVVAGALNMPKRPFIGGMLFGCLIVKPQLAPLLPIAFIVGREWKAFAGATFSSLGLLLLALLFFGADSYAAMPKLMPFYASIASEGLVGWHKMPSVYASLRLAGMTPEVAWTFHVLVALAATAMVCFVWFQPLEMSAKAAVLVAASTLVSPYLFIYDTVMLIVPFLWLAARRRHVRLLALLWCIPLLSLGQSWWFNKTLNLMPLVPIALLLLMYRNLVTDLAVMKAPIRVAVLTAILLVAAPLAARADCAADCTSRYYDCTRGDNDSFCLGQQGVCLNGCTLAREHHGAIAYSAHKKVHGYSFDYDSLAAAREAALRNCRHEDDGAEDCRLLVTFHDACGALALGDDGAYGSAWGLTQREASAKALGECRPHGGDSCKIKREVCSR